ncbi:MAG: PAS domain S-box protein, partial [Candidatus Aminicenantales bacterium]
MKIKGKVIAASFAFGLLFWIIDTFVSYSVFYREETLLGLLITRVPRTAVYMRLVVLGFFIIFGVLMADLLARSRQAAEELRESEKKFRSITASAKDAIIMIDNDGIISYWNEAAEIIFRYRKREVLGQEVKFLIPERYHEAFDEGFRKFRLTGTAPLIGRTLELSGIRKGGDEIPLEISFSSVKIKNKWNALGIIRDITQRKKAEQELRIKDLAVDSTINAVALLEPRGRLTYVNPAFCRMWGYGEKEAVGRHFVEIWQDEHRALDILDFLKERGSYIGELVAKRKDESLFHVQISASMVKDETDRPVSIISSFIDITDRKAIEKKLEDRFEFEKLVTTISTNFINLPSERIDSEINNALQAIGEFADADRSYVALLSQDQKYLNMSHEWCSNLVRPLIQTHQGLPVDTYQWQIEKIQNRETIYATNLKEIPEDAGPFKKALEHRGVISLIQVP